MLYTDAMLLALGGFGLSAFHRGGPWLVATALCIGTFGAAYPGYIDELFIGFSVFIPTLFLAWGRGALREVPGERVSGADAEEPPTSPPGDTQ